MIRPPPRSPLFPSTPLFRSLARAVVSDWNSGARVLEHGAPRQHEQISTWSVPLRWFVLVEAEDRELVLDPQRRRSEEHTSELQSHLNLVCRLLLEKKKISIV